MTATPWQQIEPESYEDHWAPFDAHFTFRPRSWQHGEPAINEPVPSLTIDLAPIFARSPSGFAAAHNAVNALGLLAMTRAFPSHSACWCSTAAPMLVVLAPPPSP
ncbi:DUF2716 domain-containing protein [Nonomuraea sp. NPDC049709]|uniref:DUF2716 domain-containing protein n=1 Tax=Nonomuraea sp. NPDC049709 TaxID=3154736 RepID=UPI003442DDB4